MAFDFGASGGRAMLGSLDGGKITLEEIHRFSNDPVMVGKTFYWDTLRQFFEIKQGILKAKLAGGFDSIGINTWGVDFGLLGEDGALLENCVHYRDKRTSGMLSECEKLIPLDELYRATGNQIMEINTAFQLLSLKNQRPSVLARAKKLLLTPDLFNYFLTGEMKTEYSIASTTQLTDPFTRSWNLDVIRKLGLPETLFTEIVASGTEIGKLSDDICEELGVEKCPVIAVCGHDTQDAVTAVPTCEEDFIYISCGTWSLFGTELDEPVVNETTARLNLTNEGGYNKKTTLLNNIIGLWLIQESRRQWAREGKEYSYAELERQALEAKPFASFIDPDHPDFTPTGNLPQRIAEYCKRTNQHVPTTVGETMRCIYESLAMKYRYSLELIKETTCREYGVIHIVGGGTKDGLLCKMTADFCNVKVVAGPVEATVLGNIAIQLIACGEIENLAQARRIIKASQPTKEFLPNGNTDEIDSAYKRFCRLVKQS